MDKTERDNFLKLKAINNKNKYNTSKLTDDSSLSKIHSSSAMTNLGKQKVKTLKYNKT